MKQFILNLIKTIGSSSLFKTIKQFIHRLVGDNTPTINQNKPVNRPTTANTPPPPPSSTNPLSNYESYIIIAMSPSGKVDFLYDWKSYSPATAKRYAELLYHLNEGHFTHEIMRHLTSFQEKTSVHSDFINSIITEWNNILQEIKPAVRPLAFFRHGKVSNEP